jgi:6-phosphogluconolactonase
MEAHLYLSAWFVAALALLLLMLGSQTAGAAESHGQYFVYVGTRESGKTGIYVYRFHEDSGKITPLGLAAETASPFSLVASRNGRYLYVANIIEQFEGKASGSVAVFAIDRQTGKLALLNQVATRGTEPAYVSMDRTERFVLVANYGSGSLAVLPVRKDGGLGEVTAFVQHTGSSVDPKRQEGPHPHSFDVSPDNRFALAADLGVDKLFVYRFNSTTGLFSPAESPYVTVKPGSGPRHIDFSPNGRFVYLLCEMASTITVYSYNAASGALHDLQVVSALPKGFTGGNWAAEIKVASSGRFLYASNRGNDTIAVFAISPQKGTLTPIAYVPTQGKEPWMFAIDPDGSYLVAPNKDSDNIVVFRVHQKSGRLTPTGQVLNLHGPICVGFVAVH